MDRRRLLGVVGTGATAILGGCSGFLGGGDDRSGTDDSGGGGSGGAPHEWPSVGRTPRNHANNPTAETPRGESEADLLSRRWAWRPPTAEEAAGDDETTFTGDVSGAVGDDEYLYTVVSGTAILPDGETEPLNTLFAVDPGSGETVWQSSFTDGSALGGVVPPTVTDDRIVLAGRALHAFRDDGDRAWQVDPAQVAAGPPVATGDELYLPTNGGVECRALGDGREHWTAPVGAVTGSSTVAVADDTVYVSRANEVVALARNDGTEQWRSGAGTESAVSPGIRTTVGSPVVDDDRVYVAGGLSVAAQGDNAALVALDRTGGTEQWRYRPEPSAAGEGPPVAGVYGLPALVDDRLIAVVRVTGGDPTGFSEFGLVAVDTAEGTELWRSALGPTLGTSVVGAGDTVYAGTGGAPADETENALQGFTVADGSPVGVGETDGMGGISIGQPAAVVDDAVVVPTRDGLVAFGDTGG